MAAGGIVMRREQPPLLAVVRLRKRDEWVLPKGKLDEGETARAAAKREVLEETGHNVTVHEFLGTLVYESGGRSKVVHYWRMEAGGTQTRELMHDIRAVDWLPLDEALVRLSRGYERTFLENVGPLAVSVMTRRLKAKAQTTAVKAPPAAKAPPAVKAPPAIKAPPVAKAAPAKKRRVKPQPPVAEPVSAPLVEPELLPDPTMLFAGDAGMPEVPSEPELSQAPAPLVDEEFVPQAEAGEAATDAAPESDVPEADAAEGDAAEGDAIQEDGQEDDDDTPDPDGKSRKSLAQKVRNWLGRAA
jgi:8-oxo-dGTP diphosphatase